MVSFSKYLASISLSIGDNQYLKRELIVRSNNIGEKPSLCSKFFVVENLLVVEAFVQWKIVVKCFAVLRGTPWERIMLTFCRWRNLRWWWMTRMNIVRIILTNDSQGSRRPERTDHVVLTKNWKEWRSIRLIHRFAFIQDKTLVDRLSNGP